MVTPDKDYGQLISENIFQFKPGKSGGDNEIIDVQKVCEKYNISSFKKKKNEVAENVSTTSSLKNIFY